MNIRTVEYRSPLTGDARKPVQENHPHSTFDTGARQVEKQQRSRDLDPQRAWRGM